MTSFTAAWIWTLIRSVLLIAVSLPCCGLLVRWIGGTRDWKQTLQWILLSTPFLFPELLTGYAYGQMTRLLITDAWIRELWFDWLMLLRIVPIGTCLWYCAPPSPLSREAIHARELAFRGGETRFNKFWIRLWYRIQGPAGTALFAGSGLFLAVFQEFELASLLAVRSWTVWLFDAQVEGLSPWASLRHLVAPVLMTWIACGSLPWYFLKRARASAEFTSHPGPLPRWIRFSLWFYLFLGCTVVVIYPLGLIGLESVQGLAALVHNPVHLRGLAEGILIAGGSALIVTILADLAAESLVAELPPPLWKRAALLGVSCGLAGPLAVGLSLLVLFQQPGLIAARDTSIPVICGLFVWLLPRAIVLQGIRRSVRSVQAEHAASILMEAPDRERRFAAKRVQWLIRDRGQFAARVLLFHWAYWELTLPSLLNPAGLVAAPVRLYIDAHFARNALLTAKAGVMLWAPVFTIVAIWGLAYVWKALRTTSA